MTQLEFDSDESSEFIAAIQTIVNIISTERKARKAERETFLSQIKILESERQQFMQKKCNHSPSDELMVIDSNECHRKRIKTEQIAKPNLNHTAHDISNDDLNAAFHEDDVVGPTQYPPLKLSVHKPKKVSTPNRDSYLKEQNKENNDAIINNKQRSPKAVEKSPTVLNKHISKFDSKSSSTAIESTSCHSNVSIKDTTPRRLFDNWSTTKNALPTQQPKVNTSTRKKLSLSLNPNTTKLKQSTINFTKRCDEEETFCEGVSLEMDVNQLPETSVNASDLADTTMLNASKVFEGLSTNDVSVKLEISSNEVIMIDESQSTQELYRFVANIKEELAENSPPKSKDQSFVNPTQTPSKLNNPPATNALGIDCEACNEYHRMLGRDVEKNPPKKFGVCGKHRRTRQGAETPPGFWNPKIDDSDSDHEETPFDPRYVKNKMK